MFHQETEGNKTMTDETYKLLLTAKVYFLEIV